MQNHCHVTKLAFERAGEYPRKPLAALLLSLALILLSPRVAPADTFAVSPLADGILAGTSVGLAGASELFFHRTDPLDLGTADPAKINGFDRLAVFGYSHGLDLTSDFALYTTLAVPAALCLFLSPNDAVAVLVTYVETVSLADFSKNLLKYLFPRQRPWMSEVGAGGAVPDTWEGDDSFPSGHATLSFAAAVFGLFAFATYFPNSPYLWPFVAVDLGLAVGTSALRVTSGMHFLTDVLAGAALGTAFGALIPLLHQSAAWKTATGKSIPPMQVQILTIAL